MSRKIEGAKSKYIVIFIRFKYLANTFFEFSSLGS